jgi:EAL domain-containing protein (putative c-di-GMP-specific phosphodiesterase class I)
LPIARERTGRRYVEAVISRRAFSLVYQPILHLDTGTVSGVEALCRFHDGRPPDLWFEQCEAFGLAPAIDLAIIQLVADDLDRLPSGYVAINLSPMSLQELQPIEGALLDLARRRTIVLEITERTAIADYDMAAASLARLRSAGVLLAVDDAGAGHSSLLHVLRLRPEIIKLDRSITASIDADPSKRALAAAMGIFAGETGAVVVAEGVETDAEVAALRGIGVTRGQGFGLAMPSAPPLPEPTYRPQRPVDLRDAGRPTHPSARVGGGEEWAQPDAAAAVAAHGLLASLGSMSTAVGLLREMEATEPEQLRALCSVLERQISHVGGVLSDLVRGLPAETVSYLEGLTAQRR